MYYHVRLDKVGHVVESQSYGFEAKDFHSLEALLGWAQKTYGDGASSWCVMGVDGNSDRATMFVDVLRTLLNDDYQYLYMALSTRSSDYGKCESYCFNLFLREDEPECGFSYSELEEAALIESSDLARPEWGVRPMETDWILWKLF